ncbi:MAG: molybdenum cofactor biosynthesis protein MoaE [Alphaproteobacteria bacterium]
MQNKIIIQKETIHQQMVYDFLQHHDGMVGAMVVFNGVMRRHNKQGDIKKIIIEHYDTMTHRAIDDIINHARKKFIIDRVMVMHRVGDIKPSDNIVIVGVAAAHRASAFQAATMIMDFLKSDVPIWKKEIMANGESWVEQKTNDRESIKKWQ